MNKFDQEEALRTSFRQEGMLATAQDPLPSPAVIQLHRLEDEVSRAAVQLEQLESQLKPITSVMPVCAAASKHDPRAPSSPLVGALSAICDRVQSLADQITSIRDRLDI